MERSTKIAIVAGVVASLGIFGYFQYVLASQISVEVVENHLLEDNGSASTYSVQLEFNNPSLLVLTTGETRFTVIMNDEVIGYGKMDPFTLPALNGTITQATFTFEGEPDADDAEPSVQISGTTRYDLFSSPIDIPFVYSPTSEQAREFIDMASA